MYQNLNVKLKKFGFTSPTMLDQYRLFVLLEKFPFERVERALDITIKKFTKKKVNANQFQSYWLMVCRGYKRS
jgi:hypothetical protein